MRAVLLLSCMCLMSCSIFRKTVKTEAIELGKLEKTVDSRSLILKTALKETNTLTYNRDGSILQFQQIQEEVAQSQAVQVLGTEHLSSKKQLSTKEEIPLNMWIVLVTALIVLAGVFWFIKAKVKIR
jgi:hypothetical protein